FNAYSGFIAREQWLAKAGQENQENLNGHAALWRSSFVDKQQAFSILSHLEIVENRADQPDPCIIFRKTEHTNPLANFRVGDLAALYPAADADETVLDHQVIKCIITELGKETVTVQLRYRQFNLKPFDTDDLWRLEPDLLEMGFASMYRSLFEWAEAPVDIRSRLLFPSQSMHKSAAETEADISAQHAAPDDPDSGPTVLEKITQSKHFFLLWGPPGTGKTSVMLRDLSAWILKETDDNLLLLAYTNRAVDEICEALESLGEDIKNQYLRIGARFSTAERFRDQLLSQKIIGVETRAELLQILQSRRIFVSTVASFSQNDSLLKIKKFQRLVVDEASQLLEPQVIGLLSRFEHFVLIGDHRQLPAITVQPTEITTVDDPDLQGIGLSDLRDSYFERLYRLCAAQGMHAHYARLSRQGRMHEDIMLFPNKHFYNGYLKTLPNADAETDPQRMLLKYDLPGIHPEFERVFAENRVVFLPTAPEHFVPGQKTSLAEAALAAELTVFFKKLFAHNGLPWIPEKTLGIISPWRAQIAQMRECLSAAGQSPDEITIDTVERYQGGARDIIIISCCVHTAAQLGSLVNISGEGVDRKLNVALTRARKHVIVLGNPEILQQDAHYRAFIEAYGRPPNSTQTTL
ncbi:MAG: AAA domain-containing protein, partial [Bacteroidota bacterium]